MEEWKGVMTVGREDRNTRGRKIGGQNKNDEEEKSEET